MDEQIKLWLDEIHVLCHRIDGYLDGQEAVKQLRLREINTIHEENGCTIFQFPNMRDDRAISDAGNEEPAVIQKNQEKGIIQFTSKEICKMPQPIRKYFRIDGIKVRYRKKKNGIYELRCQINKQLYYGAATVLKQAKKRFIEALHKNTPSEQVQKPIPETTKTVPTLAKYAMHYLETFKKPNIGEKNYKNLVNVTKRHVIPHFGDKLVNEITATDCQSLLNALRNEGKKRTAETVNSLLKWFCNGAGADGYITTDVMRTVKIPKHRRTIGKRIPSEQVQAFLAQEPKENYDYLIRFLLFTGLRPVEMKSAVFTGDFVTVKNAKTPTYEDATFRTLPIHSQLKPYISKIMEILSYSTDCLNHKFKRHFPEYRLYDCRHTFTSQAQESGVNKEWLDYITNHVSAQNVTDRVYTHWSDSFSILQMEKIRF